MREEFTRLLRDQQKTDGAPRLRDACCSPDGYCTYFLLDNGSAWQATLDTPQPVRVPHLINKHVTAIATNGSAIVRSMDNTAVWTKTGFCLDSLPGSPDRVHVAAKVVAAGKKTVILSSSGQHLYVYDPDNNASGSLLMMMPMHEDIAEIDDISCDGDTVYAVCNHRRKLFVWDYFQLCVEAKPSAGEHNELQHAESQFAVISGRYVLENFGNMYRIANDHVYHLIRHDDSGHFIDLSAFSPSTSEKNFKFNKVAIFQKDEAPHDYFVMLMDEEAIFIDPTTEIYDVQADVPYAAKGPCTRAWALGGCCIAQGEDGTYYVYDQRDELFQGKTWPFQSPDPNRNYGRFWPCWRLDHFGTPHNYLQQLLHGAVSDDDMDSQITYGMPALVSAMQACLTSSTSISRKKSQLETFILADGDTLAVSETVSKTEGVQPRRTHPGLFLAAACDIPDLEFKSGQRLPSSVGSGINALDVVLEVLHGVRDRLHVSDSELAPFWGTSLARRVQGNVKGFITYRFAGNPSERDRHLSLHRVLHPRVFMDELRFV